MMPILIWLSKGPSGEVLERRDSGARLPADHRPQKGLSEIHGEVQRLASRLSLGDGLEKRPTWVPSSMSLSSKRSCKYIDIGKKEGAKLLLGGKAYQKGDCSKGYFIEPTIFGDVTPEMRIAQEEIFGPVVSVIRAEDLEDAIRIVNGTPYGLSSAIYTQDVNKSRLQRGIWRLGLSTSMPPPSERRSNCPLGGSNIPVMEGRRPEVEEEPSIRTVDGRLFIGISAAGFRKAQIDK